MIGTSTVVRVYLACRVTNMRKSIVVFFSALTQNVLRQKFASGAAFACQGIRGDLIKLLYWYGQEICLYYKVLERGEMPEVERCYCSQSSLLCSERSSIRGVLKGALRPRMSGNSVHRFT